MLGRAGIWPPQEHTARQPHCPKSFYFSGLIFFFGKQNPPTSSSDNSVNEFLVLNPFLLKPVKEETALSRLGGTGSRECR